MSSMQPLGIREEGKGRGEANSQAGRRVECTPKGREADGEASMIVNQGVGLDFEMVAWMEHKARLCRAVYAGVTRGWEQSPSQCPRESSGGMEEGWMVAHSGQVLEDQGPVAMGYVFFIVYALEAV